MRSARDYRITQNALCGYALIRLPLAETVEAITAGLTVRGWDRRALATGQPLSAALDFLDIVTSPATRYVAFPLVHDWTAIVNNQRDGSDVADLIRHLKRTQPAMAVRVVDRDASFVVQNGFRVRMQYEARIVEVQADGETTRSIACADDGGRWTFDLAGAPLRIEEQFDYGARQKRNRFTKDNLDTLLRSFGARSVTASDLEQSPDFALMTATPRDHEWRDRIDSLACSTAEAADPAHGYFQRGIGWVDHMATHAASVAADLGKAVLLNPEFEPRCRAAFELARTQLGDDAFEEALRHADRGLRRV